MTLRRLVQTDSASAMAAKEPKDPEYLSTLDRGLSVLRAFDHDHPEMVLSEVAAVTGISPAAARRCLNTLVKLGYMAQNGRRFLLRPEVLTLGSAYLSSMNIEQVVHPQLQALRDRTGDSSSLAVRSDRHILYVAHVSTDRHIRLGANVGTRFPVHATSLGKSIMAFESQQTTEKFLSSAPFERFTERTVTSAAVMRERLETARAQGYDSSVDELDYGLVSVAVPLFAPDGSPIAAINCSTSSTRVSQEELIRTRLPMLREASREIEAALRRWPVLIHSLERG